MGDHAGREKVASCLSVPKTTVSEGFSLHFAKGVKNSVPSQWKMTHSAPKGLKEICLYNRLQIKNNLLIIMNILQSPIACNEVPRCLVHNSWVH